MILLPTTADAQMYDVETTGEYVMGDSDTKIEARKIALEHAKRLAVEQIGTYLESETIVKNRMLTKDEIRTYTSAIVKTTVISENINLLEDKTTVFKIHIKANVDIGVLNNRVQEIGADTKRKEQMNALQAENLRLLKELESLSSQLKSEKVSEYKNLRQKREILFEKLEQNQNSLRVAFEKGTLLNLALKSKSKLEENKKNIDDFIQFIADNIKYTIGEVQVRHKGNMSDLIIPITWYTEKVKDIWEKIELFCDKPKEFMGRIILSKFKGIDSEILLDYFARKGIRIIVTSGYYSSFIPIKWGGWYHRATEGNLKIALHGSQELEIKDIPVEELTKIISINAKVVVQGAE